MYMQPQLNYIQAAVDTVMSIVKGEGRGDVLVFLPGMEVRRFWYAMSGPMNNPHVAPNQPPHTPRRS